MIYHEPIAGPPTELVPNSSPGAEVVVARSANSARSAIGTTAIEEGILSGEFLALPVTNHRGPERLLWQMANRARACAGALRLSVERPR